jgi:hypothetical protein
MLFAYHKMRDLDVRPEDKLYVDCYLEIATMPFQKPHRWVDVYGNASPAVKNIFRKSKLRESKGMLQTGINPDILDLTVVVLDLIESQPGDPYWPQTKMIKALRLSVEQPGGLLKMADLLGICEDCDKKNSKKVLK